MRSGEDFDRQRFFAPLSSEEFISGAKQDDVATIHNLFSRCIQHYSSHRQSKGTLYNGGMGVVGFLKWKMALSFYPADSSGRRQLLESALESTNLWLNSTRPDYTSRCTLLESSTIGALTMQIAILNSLERSAEIPTAATLLEQTLTQAIAPLGPGECEVLYGRAGCLHSVLFVRTYGGLPDYGRDWVPRLIREILGEGMKSSSSHRGRPGLMWTWHGQEYLGAAHGVVGILHTLLHFVPEMQQLGVESKNDPNYFLNLIEQTIHDLNASFCLNSGNLASSVGSTRDRLVQWCHGAPGHVLLLVKASSVFIQHRQQYLHQAKTICDTVIVQRGLLRKGLGLCHGIAGNAYCFLAVYRASDEPAAKEDLLRKAHAFARFGLTHLSELEHRPDNPYSLYEGMAGFVSLLIDIQAGNLDRSFFPCYEYV